MMNKQEIKSEAERILSNMCRVPAYNGTTTTDVVDYMCQNFSTFQFCNGYGRNIVFTPITQNSIAFKTVAS